MEISKLSHANKSLTVLKSMNNWTSLQHNYVKRRRSMKYKAIDGGLFIRGKRITRRSQNYPFQNSKNQTTLFCVYLFLSFMLLSGFLIETSEGSPKQYCLRHCHICKEMYGKHFLQHLCADECIESRGRSIPDCIDLNSIRDYLILSD